MSEASSDQLIDFAKLFFNQRIEIDKLNSGRGDPFIEAAIDSDDYGELERAPSRKGASRGWILPARPGQNIKFRVRYKTDRISATTHGLEIRTGYEFAAGRRIYIDGKESIFEGEGVARLKYGSLNPDYS